MGLRVAAGPSGRSAGSWPILLIVNDTLTVIVALDEDEPCWGSARPCRAAFPVRRQRLADSMADRKAVIKNADMAEDMQQDAIDCATQALEKYNIEKDIAAFIKKVSSLAGPKGLNFRDGSSP